MDPEADAEKLVIQVSQPEIKLTLAITAHLNQIVRTAVHDGKYRRPTEMDHGELVLAAASLRALFFDDTPRPMLLGFLEDHGVEIGIEAIETNIGLVLLSKLLPEPLHVSDMLMSDLLDPAHHRPVDEVVQGMIWFQDRKGLEDISRRPDLWAPTPQQGETINSGLSPFMGSAPGQLIDRRRRRVRLQEWGRVRVGYLKNVPIDRRNLISYVANKLGGVHYDSKRRPPDLNDASQFKVLATGYDWNDQSLMHAGLVAVGLACIEVLNVDELMMLRNDLARLYATREVRLVGAIKSHIASATPPPAIRDGDDEIA